MRFTTNFVYRTSNEIIHALHHLPPLKEWSLYLITATACEASAESFRSLYSRFYKRCMSESEESIELLPYSHSPLPEADWDLKSDLSVTNEYMNNFKTKMYDPCEDVEIQYTEDDSFLIDQDDTSVDTNKIYSRYSSFRTNSSPYTNALDATAPDSTSPRQPLIRATSRSNMKENSLGIKRWNTIRQQQEARFAILRTVRARAYHRLNDNDSMDSSMSIDEPPVEIQDTHENASWTTLLLGAEKTNQELQKYLAPRDINKVTACRVPSAKKSFHEDGQENESEDSLWYGDHNNYYSPLVD